MPYSVTDHYQYRVTRSPKIKGWDDTSLQEFDNRYARGDSQKELARAFNISEFWVNVVARRRGLPKRIAGHRQPTLLKEARYG